MLAGVKFIPREEAERHAEEKERARAKKRKHKDKDRARGKVKDRDRRKRSRSGDSGRADDSSASQDSDSEGNAATLDLQEDAKTRRKEAGLEWMLHAPERPFSVSGPSKDVHDNPTLDSEKPEAHARELNPYLAAGEENGQTKMQKTTLPLIGDGGASWRLKALKRAQEQAEREGRKLDEVVHERWDSLGSLTSSVAVKRSAHVNAHLHAIRDRKSRKDGEGAEVGTKSDKEFEERSGRGADRESHREHGSRMKVPHLDSNLSWKSRKKYPNQPLRDADASVVRVAARSLNKYKSDGSFLKSFETNIVADDNVISVGDLPLEKPGEQASTIDSFDVVYEPTSLFNPPGKPLESSSDDEMEFPQSEPVKPLQAAFVGSSSKGLSDNQVAAKVMRLRLMGKAKEADALQKDFEGNSKSRQGLSRQDFAPAEAERPRQVTGHGVSMTTMRAQDKFRANNRSSDAELAGTIVHNKLYKGNEDDEYDNYGNGLETERTYEKRNKHKGFGDKGMRQSSRDDFRHIVTKQEQCQFCFENSQRPKHLVIAIANFVYLMIPPTASLVPFHCYIVPMQHDGATRNVDESVWQELRNFKKCLVQMFGDLGKEVLFLETAMGLARQRRHCYIECIPVPSDAAKDAPLYFKKAIDEVEDEWSQHNAKKLIDTRQKGLRNSIPKNFPYFHVEFGIQGGYCHIIDDENSFKPQFGRNVVAGILEASDDDDDVSRGRSRDSVEEQRKKVKEFVRLWEPFDWTKMLD